MTWDEARAQLEFAAKSADKVTAGWVLVSAAALRLLLAHAVPRADRERVLRRLAKEATNGWACYAKRRCELDEIARLHREIDAIAVEEDRDD